jgi:hypothetical protein
MQHWKGGNFANDDINHQIFIENAEWAGNQIYGLAILELVERYSFILSGLKEVKGIPKIIQLYWYWCEGCVTKDKVLFMLILRLLFPINKEKNHGL